MTHQIDSTDVKILRQVALKAAADLAKGVEYNSDDAVLQVAEKFNDWLLAPFEVTETTTSNGSSGSRSSGFGSGQKKYEDSGDPCPHCLENGRSGTIMRKLSGGGPIEKCSLEKVEKRNGQWVEVGECSYTKWPARR